MIEYSKIKSNMIHHSKPHMRRQIQKKKRVNTKRYLGSIVEMLQTKHTDLVNNILEFIGTSIDQLSKEARAVQTRQIIQEISDHKMKMVYSLKREIVNAVSKMEFETFRFVLKELYETILPSELNKSNAFRLRFMFYGFYGVGTRIETYDNDFITMHERKSWFTSKDKKWIMDNLNKILTPEILIKEYKTIKLILES